MGCFKVRSSENKECERKAVNAADAIDLTIGVSASFPQLALLFASFPQLALLFASFPQYAVSSCRHDHPCSMHTNRCHPKMVFNVYKLLSPVNGVQCIQIVVTRNGVQCIQIVVTRKWCSMCTNCCYPKMLFIVYKLLSPENGVQCVKIIVT